MQRVVACIVCALHGKYVLDVLEGIGHPLYRRVPHTALAALMHGFGIHEQSQPRRLIGGITGLSEVARGLTQDFIGEEFSPRITWCSLCIRISALDHCAHLPVACRPGLQARRAEHVMRCFRGLMTVEQRVTSEAGH